jgi:hypothetical protein
MAAICKLALRPGILRVGGLRANIAARVCGAGAGAYRFPTTGFKSRRPDCWKNQGKLHPTGKEAGLT